MFLCFALSFLHHLSPSEVQFENDSIDDSFEVVIYSLKKASVAEGPENH